MFRICAPALLLFSLISLILPASAQWKDITTGLEGILNGKTRFSPVYLQEGSVRNIKSVNFKNTVYRRGVFSYVLGGSTIRSTYLFDCQEANYKTSDTQGGYWVDLSWITPSTDRDSFNWAAYKYLCSNSKDPWFLIATNSDDEQYYVNIETGYSFNSPLYGKVKTWVMAKHKEKVNNNSYSSYGRLLGMNSGPDTSDLLRLYVSCKIKLVSIYNLLSDPSDTDANLLEVNPNSVGEEMLSSACST
jgi:hypothetical protein